MSISSAQYRIMVARKPSIGTLAPRAVDLEGDLHSEIAQFCRSKGWLALHGRMDRRTHRTEGEPDFTILAEGRVLFVECKSKKGKRSTAQLAFAAMALRLGHTVHEVRSLEEFAKIAAV